MARRPFSQLRQRKGSAAHPQEPVQHYCPQAPVLQRPARLGTCQVLIEETEVRQQAVGVDLDKALGQDVLNETAEKLHRLKGILALLAGGSIFDL
jgi:hypothetical protein